MRRTKADAEQTRQQVLDAALRIFGCQGYNTATLDDIAREAAVTRGAIYWHFKGKADLCQALLAGRQRPATDVLATALVADAPPVEGLRTLITRSIALLEEDTHYRATMELSLFKTGAAPELASGLAQKVVGLRGIRASLVELVHHGQQQGSFRSQIDPEVAATTILSVLNGVALTWLLDEAAFSPAAQAAAIAEALLTGLTTDAEFGQ
jgi:TetR/AcrR family transcriptional regulator, acrAB operon repressor